MIRKCEGCGKEIKILANFPDLDSKHFYCPKCFDKTFEEKTTHCEKCGRQVPRRCQNCFLEVHNQSWLLCGACQIEAERMIDRWINE